MHQHQNERQYKKQCKWCFKFFGSISIHGNNEKHKHSKNYLAIFTSFACFFFYNFEKKVWNLYLGKSHKIE